MMLPLGLALVLSAAGALAGLFSPPSAAGTVAVTPATGGDATVAARAVYRAIDQTWSGLRPLAYDGDAAASDCRVKPFAADVRVEADDTSYEDGIMVEVTFDLLDCAGWQVDRWTEQRLLPNGSSRDEVMLALRTLARRATTDANIWRHVECERARRLFSQGLASIAGDPPTYLYSFYKSTDGQMRIAVRAGGPAWEAGIRSGDVMQKLDGKAWWEYGTFQTQRRAYDGLPHTFVLERGKRRFEVALGAPLVPR
ncbi:MAG: hypothetical protein KGM44_10440 [bacterium]|nr:hypothetical protein [bacterium]